MTCLYGRANICCSYCPVHPVMPFEAPGPLNHPLTQGSIEVSVTWLILGSHTFMESCTYIMKLVCLKSIYHSKNLQGRGKTFPLQLFSCQLDTAAPGLLQLGDLAASTGTGRGWEFSPHPSLEFLPIGSGRSKNGGFPFCVFSLF